MRVPAKKHEVRMQISALTFQRPFNLRAMEWAELDLEKRAWIIPASKMKMRVTRKETAPPHRIPLSKAALTVIAKIPKVVDSPYCFPNQRSAERPMSDAGVARALQALGYSKEQMSHHGFRSSASSILNASRLFLRMPLNASWPTSPKIRCAASTTGRTTGMSGSG